MSIELPWNFQQPTQPGIYFVALKLGASIGVYDFLLWSGTQWETDQKGEVIAHIDANALKNALDIKWPEDVEVNYERKPIMKSDDELWTEE